LNKISQYVTELLTIQHISLSRFQGQNRGAIT